MTLSTSTSTLTSMPADGIRSLIYIHVQSPNNIVLSDLYDGIVFIARIMWSRVNAYEGEHVITAMARRFCVCVFFIYNGAKPM